MPPAPRKLVLAANSSWNILNFRAGLVRGLQAAGYEVVALAPEDAASAKLSSELGIEHRPIRIDRSGMNPVADLSLLASYRRVLREVAPAAFLGFTAKPNVYGSLAASSLDIPVVANVSGLGTAFMRKGPLQRIVTALYRRAFRNAAAVFFHNPDDRRLFVERGIVRQEQARLLPGSGVDLERFRPAPLADGPCTFLLIARLLRDKGVREFVDAARSLRPSSAELRFQLLGGIDRGNRSAIGQDELDRWVHEGTVDYLGERNDVRPAIAQASALVLPSYREGLPRSLLEGAAMARPLIATDVPGCRELVQQGLNGYLCDVQSGASLAGAMAKLAGLSSGDRAAMGAASRRMVEERFSEQLVIDAYLQLLDQLRAH